MKSLIKFSHFLFGTLFYAMSQWLTLMLLVKKSNPEIVGQYGLALAIASPVILFTNMHLRTVLSTDVANDISLTDYFRFRQLSTTIFLVIVVLLSLVCAEDWPMFMVILLVALCKGVESFSDLFFGLFNKYGVVNFISTSMLIKGVSSIVSFSIGLLIFSSLQISLVLMFALWGICFLFFDKKNANKWLITKDRNLEIEQQKGFDTVKKILIIGVPLSIVALLDSFNTYLPRYLLQAESGRYAVGIFTALYYVIMAGNTAVNAIAQTLNPLLAKEVIANNLKGFYRLTKWYLFGGLLAGGIPIVLAVYFGEYFLHYFYGPEYAAYAKEFVFVLIGGLFAYCAVLAWHINVAIRQISRQPIISILTVLTTAVLGIIFIPGDPVFGSALAMVGGRLVQLVGNVILIRHSISLRFGS